MQRMRISDADLRKKILRHVLEADPSQLATLANSLLGIRATYDSREFCEWEIEAIAGEYQGAFDVEGLSPPEQTAKPELKNEPKEGNCYEAYEPFGG